MRWEPVCLRCGAKGEDILGVIEKQCRACDFEWYAMADGMVYTLNRGDMDWKDVPAGCLGVFNSESVE